MSFEIGARVETERNGKGSVAFCGTTQFAEGEWVGVILDEARGKNNGTVKEVKYFECEPNFGLFVKSSQLKLESAASASVSQQPKSRMPVPSSGLKAPVSQIRKESMNSGKKLSPGTSPKMSPAGSVEKLTKTTRMGSTSKLASASRESSNISQGSAVAARQSLAGSIPTPKTQKPTSQAATTPSPPKKEEPPARAAAQLPAPLPETPQIPVADRVKMIKESSNPPSPSFVPSGMDVGTENEYLKVQVKDLSEKLETLKQKRKEDQQKLSEVPILKAELDSLQSVKQKLHDEHVDLTRQLQEEKKLSRELRDLLDSKNEEYSTSAEMMEMATIDKEMAEERAEALQGELDHYKSRTEELEAELELLKEEMAAGGADGRIPEGNSVQVKQLEQQNIKLKEALIKLRDLNGQAVEDRNEAVKEAERLRNENLALINRTEAAIRQADEVEKTIQLYQEQVDAALGAEEMVTALTSQNLNMEDKIRKLEQEMEDLEELHDMDEQIIETLKQGEKDLKGDIEALKSHIFELNNRIRDEQRHAATLSETILKFRTKTQQLNEEIQDLKDQVLNYEDQLNGQRAEENTALSVASQMQVSAGKQFAENVEKHVALIELDFARKQIGYLKAFLPDNFTKHGGDNDSINLIVMFPRMILKSQILSKLAAERFPQVAGGMRREHVTRSHKAEQWAHAAKLAFATTALAAVLGQFESATQNIPLERLATQQPEMGHHEKTLDNYLELLKQGRFDENTALDQLDKAVLYFQNKFSVDVGGGTFAAEKWVAALLKQLQEGLVWLKTNSARLNHFLENGSDSSQMALFLKRLNDEVTACEQLAYKAAKRVPNDGQRILKLNPEFTEELQSAMHQIDRIASVLHETASIASVQIGMLTESDGFPSDRMKEMLHAVVEKSHGSLPLDKAFDPLERQLVALRDALSKVSQTLENGLMEENKPEKKAYPALLDRAHQRKQAAAEAESLRWQLEKKDNEILELKKLLKSRIDDISNYKLRLDMAEAKMDSAGKQDNAKTLHLESKIEQMVNDQKKKQNEFDEALDRLQRDINALTKENEELKERAKHQSKMKLLQSLQSSIEPRSSGLTPSGGSSTALSAMTSATFLGQPSAGGGSADLIFLQQRLLENQQALERANLEIIRLKAQNALTNPTFSGCLRVPPSVAGPLTLRYANTEGRDDVLEALEKEAIQLKRDELKYLIYVPDNNKYGQAAKEHRAQWLKERDNFNLKVQSVRLRLRRYWSEKHPDKEFPTLFDFIGVSEAEKENVTKPKPKFEEVCRKWGIAV